MQQIRALAKALKVRFRAEVALGRFDDAIRTAKTMFAMSRHLGEHPTLVGNLVGLAIASVAIGPPGGDAGAAGLPQPLLGADEPAQPLVSLDKGMEGERVLVLVEFRDLDDSAPMSADQLKKFIAHMDKLLVTGSSTAKPTEPVRAWLDARTKDERMVSAARHRLVERGLSEERLLRFPADQVILLDEKREYEVPLRRRHENHELARLAGRSTQRATIKNVNKAPALFADVLLPGVYERPPGARRGWTSGSRCCDTSRPCASTPPSTMAHCPRNCPTFPCRCPTTRSPASRSATKLTGNTAHLRGSPPAGGEKNPSSTSITR